MLLLLLWLWLQIGGCKLLCGRQNRDQDALSSHFAASRLLVFLVE